MTAWYIGEPIRNGSDGLGVTGVMVTSNCPVLVIPVGTRRPFSTESADELLAGSESRWKVETTSSAVSGVPSWNLTPCRIVKTHDLPLPSGVFQAVAISGFSWPVAGLT